MDAPANEGKSSRKQGNNALSIDDLPGIVSTYHFPPNLAPWTSEAQVLAKDARAEEVGPSYPNSQSAPTGIPSYSDRG